MSRLTELKKQYPELNVSVIDILRRMDPTDSYKYLPLLCKIFSEKFKHGRSRRELQETLERYQSHLENRGVDFQNLALKELMAISEFGSIFYEENFMVSKEFIQMSEKNLLENKDITSYSGLEDMRQAISLASIKELNKALENEVHKEYEDEKWVCVRPLSFASSQKYGATTKWCTTYVAEKQYFERYWRRGILVYFINKLNGYKVAAFKALDGDSEFSFWNAEDSRVDFLEINFDDYLYSIIRAIFKSNKTNQSLCTEEIQKQVNFECVDHSIKKMAIREIGEPVEIAVEIDRLYSEGPMEVNEAMSVTEVGIDQPSEEYYFHRGIDASVVRDITEAPVYEERPSIA